MAPSAAGYVALLGAERGGGRGSKEAMPPMESRGGTWYLPGDGEAQLSYVVALATLALSLMLSFSLAYIYVADDDNELFFYDQAGGWSQDVLLAIAALLFALSSRVVAEDEYVTFYLGTAVAYGFGGAGHFLEDSTSPAGLTGYYLLMTLAFGGDAVRAAYGYALPSTPRVDALRGFAKASFVIVCIAAALSLRLLTLGMSAAEVLDSYTGLAWRGSQMLMGVVEIGGSVAWVLATYRANGLWSVLGASANISGWVVVKFVPTAFQQYGVVSSVAHRLAHYMQYLLLWTLHSLALRRALRSKDVIQTHAVVV